MTHIYVLLKGGVHNYKSGTETFEAVTAIIQGHYHPVGETDITAILIDRTVQSGREKSSCGL